MARRSRAIPVKVGLQAEFEKHSRQVYDGMKGRFAAKKNDAGVITRAAREIPFSLEQLRQWLLAGAFRGSWDNPVKCCYCTRWLNALDFVLDHKDPVKYGGSLDLDNLDVCCQECNTLKGVMSADGFRRFLEWVTLFLHPQDAADVMGRMKNGAGYMRLKIQAIRGRGRGEKYYQKAANSLLPN